MVDVELSKLLRRVVSVAVELSRLFSLEEMVLWDNVQEAIAL